MTKKKLVILVAPTGGNAVDREGAHVPTTAEEIAEEAQHCCEAGASVLHIHARDPKTKLATSDLSVFSDIIKRVRAKCDILIQTTTGIGMKPDEKTDRFYRPSHEERLGLLSIVPQQDLVTIAAGSWDLWRPEADYPATPTYQNPPHFLIKNIASIVAKKLPWELEIADTGFLYNALKLAEQGVFDRHDTSFWLDYCLGFGAMPATARHLIFAQEEGQRLFPQAKWSVLATSKDQFPMNTLGVAMGCDIVRVGFEDNIYLPDGKPARHNYQLVEAMARIARDCGRDVATVDEAKEIFGIRRRS
jgi:3-keto-5-aminohexanoate cleavage enzyme